MQYTIHNTHITMQGKCLEAVVEFDGLIHLNIVFNYHGDVLSIASMTPVNTLQRLAFASCELFIEQHRAKIYTEAKDIIDHAAHL